MTASMFRVTNLMSGSDVTTLTSGAFTARVWEGRGHFYLEEQGAREELLGLLAREVEKVVRGLPRSIVGNNNNVKAHPDPAPDPDRMRNMRKLLSYDTGVEPDPALDSEPQPSSSSSPLSYPMDEGLHVLTAAALSRRRDEVVAVDESGGSGGGGGTSSRSRPTLTGGELLSRAAAVAAALRAAGVAGGGGGGGGGGPVVGLYKLNPDYPQLESAWFQPLNLSSEKLVSKFAFEFNLHRYTVVGIRLPHGVAFLTAFYGVLAAGGAACPLERAYPAAFVKQLAAGAGMEAAVAEAGPGPGPGPGPVESKHGNDGEASAGSGSRSSATSSSSSSFPPPELHSTFRVVIRLDPLGRLASSDGDASGLGGLHPAAELVHSPAPPQLMLGGGGEWGEAGTRGWGRRAMCVTTTSGTTVRPLYTLNPV
jgi:hypothetical protein